MHLKTYSEYIYFHSLGSFKTLDVLREMKGLSPENDENLDEKEDSFISVIQNEPIKDEQSTETQSATLPVSEGETSSDHKQTKKLDKQVSWSDTRDAKSESSDSGDESLQDDEDSKKLNSVSDSGVALNDHCMVKEKDSKTDQAEGEVKEKEKDDEPGKFDGVFSDTDDSEASGER